MRGLALAMLCVALAACGSRDRGPGATGTPYRPYMIGQPYQVNGRWFHPREDFDYDRKGLASWYGAGFQGRPTASGETYDMNALTAAHPTLPLPTIARVTNLENGRSVVLRINDRGPFVEDRIIDVSREGARALGFLEQGLAPVRVAVLKEASLRIKREAAERQGQALARSGEARPRPGQAPVAEGRIFVQAGVYTERIHAERRGAGLSDIAPIKVAPGWVRDSLTYQVRLGPVRNAEEGDRLLARVVERGFSEARVVVE